MTNVHYGCRGFVQRLSHTNDCGLHSFTILLKLIQHTEWPLRTSSKRNLSRLPISGTEHLSRHRMITTSHFTNERKKKFTLILADFNPILLLFQYLSTVLYWLEHAQSGNCMCSEHKMAPCRLHATTNATIFLQSPFLYQHAFFR